MKYKVKVIPPKCIGCGACVAVSDNFEMKGDKAIVKHETSSSESDKEATEICPTQAIILEIIEE